MFFSKNKIELYSLLCIIFIFLMSSSYSQVNITIPDTTVNLNINDEFLVPVYVSSLDGQNVRAFQFEVNYNSNYLAYVSMQKGNVISGGFYTDANETTTGKITIAGAGAYPLSGEGVLVYVKFKILAEGSSSITLSNFKFNEGSPTASITNGTVTRILDDITVPDQFSLINYPNPFSRESKIIYHLSDNCHVRLSIYSQYGQLIKVFISEVQDAAKKEVLISGADFSPGIYNCKLQIGDRQVCVTRMVVVK